MQIRAFLIICIILISVNNLASAETINPTQFKFGYSINAQGIKQPITWFIKDYELAGPGPNKFDSDCVKLDKDSKGNVKAVRLKIRNVDGIWRCAEIYTTQRFGLGTYEFKTEGRLDNFDKQIVLGLFSYPTPDVGPDGTYEIDIEFSTFGGGKDKAGCYGLCPLTMPLPKAEQTFTPSKSLTSTHRLLRTKDTAYFASYNGFSIKPKNRYANWSYTAKPNDNYIHDKAMPVHINLWLFQGQPPTNAKEVEVILKGFTFTEPK